MTTKPQSTLKLRAPALAIAAGLALSTMPFAAMAAGLGKVTVFSALGQPLRAEVEFTATREELASMKASLASPESFKAAGLDYASALQGIRFTVDKRTDGQPVIKLSTDRPINEPFVDMLMELNWASGRLVREYTFLLDPPETGGKAVAPVSVPATVPAISTAPASVPATSAVPAETGKKATPPSRAVEKAVGKPADDARSSPPGEAHEVKRGDTLRKIAAANQHEGVSLEQMLVGLYRANEEAFDGRNMNRLKSGRILTIPTKSEVESVSDTDARKVVAVQASDWNAYRRKLAAVAAQAPVKDESGKQEAAGKITARVEEKQAPASESRDQVRVSKTEVGKPGGRAGVAEDDLLAKDKALKEANERLAKLEKNIGELQKLVEMKNQGLAELQQRGKAPADVAKPVEPAPAAAKPAAAAKPEVPLVEEKKAEAPVPAAKPAEAPVEAAKPEAAKPEAAPAPKPEAAPAPKPRPKVVPPPPPEDPSFLDTLLEDPMVLAGGGGVLALLLAAVGIKRRRTGKAAEEKPLLAPATDLSQSALSENSVFRSTGGQSVDTTHTQPQTDFSQAGPGTIDTDEVDPVAEADVYMAYGRDAQAEEILLEAKAKDPKRHAIHLKLLEIYANRQAVQQFEALATELYDETGGVGPDWEKAAALGLKVDPANPLYGRAGSAPAAADSYDSDATLIIPAMAAAGVAASAMAPEALAETATMPAPDIEPAGSDEPISLDFDLAPEPEAAVSSTALDVALDLEPEPTQPPAAMEEMDALDFDLGMEAAPPAPVSDPVVDAAAVDIDAGLDFELPEISPEEPGQAEALVPDFDLGGEPAAAVAAPEPEMEPELEPEIPALAEVPAVADDASENALEFDVSLDEAPPAEEMSISPNFDMTMINLDLDVPAEPVETAEPVSESVFPEIGEPSLDVQAPPAEMEEPAALQALEGLESLDEAAPEPDNEEVTTKLDLAKAYEEMGDFEGARELLLEVSREGSSVQRATAREILERIDGPQA